MAKRCSKYLGKKKEKKSMLLAGPDGDAQWKGLVELERRCQDISREIQMLSKRQEINQNAIEGKLSVQSRASERLQDKITEEKKGTHKDRRSLAVSEERA